jgi:DNA-3-methyladenine glycosylase II
MPRKRITPANILKQKPQALRGVGLSRAKVAYLRDLAQKITERAVPLSRMENLEDEEIIEKLILVKGIGRWTAEMFLIFCQGRLDVLPVADYGFRAGAQAIYGLKELPKKQELTELAEPWRPYRSIATWYIWRSRGPVPSS